MRTHRRESLSRIPLGIALGLLLGTALALAGCGKGTATTGPDIGAPTVSMGFPTSVTGASSGSSGVAAVVPMVAGATSSGGPSCHYAGQDETDPLQNGYVMTRWLVGNVEGWLCFTDFLTDLTRQLVLQGAVPTDGTVVNLTPHSPGDPTGLSVTVTDTQRTIELYFMNLSQPGLYLSWATSGGVTNGRLIVLTDNVQDSANLGTDLEAPTHARLDFTVGGSQKSATMYMAFSPYGSMPPWSNPWATGFRVDAVKAADGHFEILGYISTKAQLVDPSYASNTGDNTKPVLALKSVSDAAGNGASVASIQDVALAFYFPSPYGALGYFRFTKDDRYYFTAAGGADWINKQVAAATYVDGGLTNSSPYADGDIDTYLSLSGTTSSCKGGTDSDCITLLNTIFASGGGTFVTDQNTGGTEPTDWRNTTLSGMTNLTQATPDTSTAGDWTGVFDLGFTP